MFLPGSQMEDGVQTGDSSSRGIWEALRLPQELVGGWGQPFYQAWGMGHSARGCPQAGLLLLHRGKKSCAERCGPGVRAESRVEIWTQDSLPTSLPISTLSPPDSEWGLGWVDICWDDTAWAVVVLSPS